MAVAAMPFTCFPTGEAEPNPRLPLIEDEVCELAHIPFNFSALRRPVAQPSVISNHRALLPNDDV